MGPVELPAWLQPRYRKNAYLFIYYLIQFCGHSWIFTNMTVRFFSFGKGSVVDTFYAIGLVMRLCQSISLLELLHIYVGIESDHLLPRLLQLTERIIILFVVITSQEEVQEKYVVCVLFIFWNLLDMVRYTYSMLSVIGISYAVLTWLSQTLWMPIYPLCVLAEADGHVYSLAKKNAEGFPGGAVVESPPANAGDTGSSPGLGRSHMPRSN
ncbi:very-long-chain (3R)-3-hydroxyacyl-CoA dehydratase 4 isoform X4 [Balaenoptera ricei]|uniref:very-long-chain (3R)-3-hydroxyacyl-CoA dehydratase 4 isoform X4 n=1 Tax=Balaenoptera ricei TaxID=2746895 RepID=UPI0028BD2A40|nr:very-long-chain (3R)-3-hydroxyacyl-CoA dehydratase 4 isoform X4 [Balaenoptera ricei]